MSSLFIHLVTSTATPLPSSHPGAHLDAELLSSKPLVLRIPNFLSAEEVEKLTAARPATLHDAGLIPGITPKAVGYLFGAIEQRRNKERLANKAKRDDAGRMQKMLENKLERFDESQPV